MSDAYRSAGHACPVCRIGMREFQGRLVCDQCTGMLLTEADFKVQLADVGGMAVSITDDTPTERPCPRCDQRLRACRVRVDKRELEHDLLHCASDGVWLPGGTIEEIFAQLGKQNHGGSAHGTRAYGGVSGNIGGAGAHGLGTAMAAVDAAFARGGANPNEILRWWDKPRPRVVTPFASVLSAQHLACPACAGKLHLHGDRWGCDAGDGVFVEYVALEAMLAEMANAPWETPAAVGPEGERGCPACSVRMVEQVIEGVTVDRCPDHGIWFDTGELERALRHTGEPKSGWFRRVFWHR